jgi:ankyrin repeat protein
MSLSPNDQSLIDQSLIVNAWGGNLIEVRDLLQRGANVNAKDGNGNTALIAACEKNADVALEILKRDNVDVNVKNIDGVTALHRACGHRLSVVALEILKREDVDVNAQHNGVTPLHYALWHRLLDVALEILNRDNVDVNVEDWARRQGLEEVISPLLQQSKQSKVVKNRTKLLELMTSTSKDDGPIELSLEFIQQFTTLRELGSGAFGKVSLVEDTHLQKKFAVKKIKLDQSDEEFIDKARKTFQKEISVRSILCVECSPRLEQGTP